MRSALKLLAVSSSILILAGCAMTNDTMKLNYHFNSANALKAAYPAKVSVSVEDKRGVDNPRLIIHKQNMYNETTSGGLLAERPLAAITQEAISSGLQQMGYQVKNNSNYFFDCELLNVEQKSVIGMFKAQVGIQIQINVRVYDKAQHRIVWQDIIVGNGSVSTAWGGEGVLRSAFNIALTNAVKQLQQSRSLIYSLGK